MMSQMHEELQRDRFAVMVIAAVIIGGALAYLIKHNQTYIHIDAIAHVNKARGLWDNTTPGLKQLGSIWLPLQHILIAPLTLSDYLWSTGLAGSLLSALCFVGTSWFLYATAALWTMTRTAGWLAFLFFALNPRLIYLFTTPMTEPLMILCASGLVFYLTLWVDTESWRPFAWACLMACAGTLTRYEGWAIAAVAIPVVFIVSRRQRVAATILFAGASSLGPMLWMIYNMVYFEDPLMFAFGRGSARDYAQEHFFRTGKLFHTAGDFSRSIATYWTDVAYCLNPAVLALALAGAILAWIVWRKESWRIALIVVALAVVPFLYYTYNLYANMVPLLMPGLVADEPNSIYNVRYGTVMAATVPTLAAFALLILFQRIEQRRIFAVALVALMFIPSPVPEDGDEMPVRQLTNNLFYTEGIHNQSFWMPPFIEVARRLQSDIADIHDQSSFILANSRIVHPVVWATAIHMKRFIYEMNKDRWDSNLNVIDPGIRWVITEEGDQLWHAQGKNLRRDWIEVASAKTPSTGVVHLYRRP